MIFSILFFCDGCTTPAHKAGLTIVVIWSYGHFQQPNTSSTAYVSALGHLTASERVFLTLIDPFLEPQSGTQRKMKP
jgi:hypothetical protein